MANLKNLKPWKPGQSGNPSGKPKGTAGLAAKARELGPRCMEVLVTALDDPDTKVRIVAAREILDRGYGKPVAMTADVTNRLEEYDDDTLVAAVDAVRAALVAAVPARNGDGAERAH